MRPPGARRRPRWGYFQSPAQLLPRSRRRARWRSGGTPERQLFSPAPRGRPGSAPSPEPTAPHSRALLLPPGHQETELLVGRVGSDLADYLARVDHDNAVGEGPYLLQLQRDEEDGLALRALLEELAV